MLWELDDQLGLPGRAVLEPLIRRAAPARHRGDRHPVRPPGQRVVGHGAGLRQPHAVRHGPTRSSAATSPSSSSSCRSGAFSTAGRLTLVIGTLAAERGDLRPAAEPRPDGAGAAAGGGRPHAPPGARRRAPPAPRAGLLAGPLRARLLAARRGLRRLVHRRARDAAGAGRAHRAGAPLRGRLPLPDHPARLGLSGGRARRARRRVGRGPRRLARRCSSASRSPPTSWSPSGRTSSTTFG